MPGVVTRRTPGFGCISCELFHGVGMAQRVNERAFEFPAIFVFLGLLSSFAWAASAFPLICAFPAAFCLCLSMFLSKQVVMNLQLIVLWVDARFGNDYGNM